MWQPGMRSCIMPGLLTHLVQELNAGTVARVSISVGYISMEGQGGQKEHLLILINDFLILINDLSISINDFLILINIY